MLVVLDVEVYPNISRNWSKAVPEGNGLVHQQEELGSDQPTLADAYRLFDEIFVRQLKLMKSHFDKLDALTEKIRATKHRLAGQKQDTQLPRVAMEADVPSDTKTRKRLEAAAAAERVICAGNSSALFDTDPFFSDQLR